MQYSYKKTSSEGNDKECSQKSTEDKFQSFNVPTRMIDQQKTQFRGVHIWDIRVIPYYQFFLPFGNKCVLGWLNNSPHNIERDFQPTSVNKKRHKWTLTGEKQREKILNL